MDNIDLRKKSGASRDNAVPFVYPAFKLHERIPI